LSHGCETGGRFVEMALAHGGGGLPKRFVDVYVGL